MKRRARGIVGLVVLSLGLGVVTTYGVAWWLMNRADLGSVFTTKFQYIKVHGELWRLTIDHANGVDCVVAEGYGSGGTADNETWEDEAALLPRWSLVRRESSAEVLRRFGDRQPPSLFVVERASGWPLRAVVERTSAAVPQRGVPGADLSLRVGEPGLFSPARRLSEVSLACLPLWPGFAVDSAAFTAAWATLLLGVRAVRQRMRLRTGSCVVCRYDLAGLTGGVCPECGSAVKGM